MSKQTLAKGGPHFYFSWPQKIRIERERERERERGERDRERERSLGRGQEVYWLASLHSDEQTGRSRRGERKGNLAVWQLVVIQLHADTSSGIGQSCLWQTALHWNKTGSGYKLVCRPCFLSGSRQLAPRRCF
jgi:hypothetical protein